MARKTEGESVGLAQFRDAMRDGDWQNLRSIKTDRNGRELEMYAKNGRLLIVQSFGESGFEVFYPSSAQKIADVIAEANAFAVTGQVTIGELPTVYIVRRGDDDLDVFSDRELAKRWARVLPGVDEGDIEEETFISESTLDMLIKSETRDELRSTIQDDEIETAIMAAGATRFSGRRIEAVYEHGHYWLQVWPLPTEIDGGVETFDVVDAVPGVDGSGFDFEEV